MLHDKARNQGKVCCTCRAFTRVPQRAYIRGAVALHSFADIGVAAMDIPPSPLLFTTRLRPSLQPRGYPADPTDDTATFSLIRCSAYSRAVRLHAANAGGDRTTRGTIRWLDIGTGSGLLASLVASTSASAPETASAPASPSRTRTEATPVSSAITAATPTTEVYACEMVAEVADVAVDTFAKNGGDVRLFRGHSTEMEVGRDLPSRVPRVISELLGTCQSRSRSASPFEGFPCIVICVL